MDTLISALTYLENGFSIIPLAKSSKTPCIHSWKKYQSQLPTTEEVKQWFTDNPDANIGIVTGKVSNLVVIDLDSEKAIETFRQHNWFDECGVVKTSRGYHLYFQYPDFEVRNAVKIETDIDIRGEGGYVVAPPSIHESGKQYTWEKRSILTQDPAKLPQAIIQYLQNQNGKTASNNSQPAKDTLDDIFTKGCQEGKRHDAGIRIAGRYFNKGLNETEVLSIMHGWNAKNKPPLPDQDIVQIVENISKHEKEKNSKIDIESFLWDSDRIAKDFVKKLRTPFAGKNLEKLESMMNGGLAGGCIYLLGGVPSAGKTVLINNVADNICLQGQPVLIFSYDDSPMELNNRTLARFSKYKMDTINKQAVDKNNMYGTLPELVKIIPLKYMPDQIYPLEQWPEFIEQIIAKHNRPPVIFIDYLKKLVTRKKNFDERMRIDEITRQLDSISKQYDLPIFAISELNRESYRAGQFITMASFKESGGLEYSASWLGIMASFEEGENNKLIQNWEKAMRNSGNIDLVILKAKRGTGKPGRIGLNINIQKMTVHER